MYISVSSVLYIRNLGLVQYHWYPILLFGVPLDTFGVAELTIFFVSLCVFI